MNEGLTRLRSRIWQICQCAVAAGVAWFIAADLFGHQQPFFAPIAAVVSLGTSYGQRLRRVGEVTIGVALGVFFGDLFTQVLGSGAWQIVVIVALGMSIASVLNAGPIFVTQVAVQGIVVSTLVPTPGDAFVRWSDALIGGMVALVAASVVPSTPLLRPRERAGAVMRTISNLLVAAADAMDDGDVDRAMKVLADARTSDRTIRELQDAASEGLSVVASSPFRMRNKEGVRRVADLVEPLDYALRNTRVLVRRVAVAAYRQEVLPAGYSAMVRELAEAADLIATELSAGRMADQARPALLRLAHATSRIDRGQMLSSEVILAQVRSTIADLLAISGLDRLAATDQIPPLR